MLSLEAIEANFIDTINNGPDVLDPALFAGPLDRVLIGLKTHANTISHARLDRAGGDLPAAAGASGSAKVQPIVAFLYRDESHKGFGQ